MAQLPNKQSLEKATVVIKPDLGGHLAADFSGLDSLIAEGEDAAEAKMPALLDSIQEKQSANYFSGPNVEQLSFKISAVSFQGSELPQNIKADLAGLTAGEKVTIGFIREKVSSLYSRGYDRDAYAEINLHDSTASVKSLLSQTLKIRSIELTGDSVIAKEELLPFISQLQNKPANSDSTRGVLNDILACIANRGILLPGFNQFNWIQHRECCDSNR